ncbi:glycoside hydrolase family 16 protein [Dendrothele bispora CBS 962.96]|uniref:Glycoside hydrolase family 16 protein n=1 Tax=Dendrothele bispora (strain CBS 962.96) TaxID=1314807 RepID=A0A4S8MHC1_DENBC|nr:glycoside hydrolase family 16 protein [Dendrothele bispora CBS 962.96]
MGNWGLIDLDTPQDLHTIASYHNPDGPRLQLVFSDEFNEDGRSFYPGDDPYWEAVNLHYWATDDLEWYDPSAVTTKNGSLAITLSEADPEFNYNLSYKSGLLTSWNKFCFTGGLIQTSVRLPGAHNVIGLWPAIWTMGNLGRAGYGASVDGLWPYSYDSCDLGTLPNQTLNGSPAGALNSGFNDGPLSFLPGQRLSRCTCPGESHPGPTHEDGSFVGRAAPEIDIFEAQTNGRQGSVSQSGQWAPFDFGYDWRNTSDVMTIYNTDVSKENSYHGSTYQEATSVVTDTDSNCYELGGTGCFSVYGFEYKPGFDNAYITWVSGGAASWTLLSSAMNGDDRVDISSRPVSQEPMYILMNLGISPGFVNDNIDFAHLQFPATMLVDYVRVYQDPSAINIGCDPPAFPTKDYINRYIEAYTNPNLTTWVDDFHQSIPKNNLVDQC